MKKYSCIGFLFLIVLFVNCVLSVSAQPISQSSLVKFVSALPSPNVCNSNNRAEALIFVKNDKQYKCVGGTYVPAEGAGGGVTAVNGRTGNISLILSDIPVLPAIQITSGVFPTARLGTGTADNTTYLRGDGTWAAQTGAVTFNSSSYANLSAAITAIGSTPAIVTLTSNLNCSSVIDVPTTLKFDAVNDAKIVKNSGCSINFQGMGIVNPRSQVQMFSGFSPGDIIWTGTTYPREISSYLFSTTDATAATQMLAAAFTNKWVTFLLFPSSITGTAEVNNKQSVEFQSGEFPNSATVYPQFRFHNDNSFTGKGDSTIVYETSAVGSDTESGYRAQIFGFPMPTSSARSGIHFSNFKIKASNLAGVSNQSTATIYLGNCSDCSIQNMAFDNLVGYPAACGGFGDTGNVAKNCHIRNNYFYGITTQNAVIFNCLNCQITGNTFVLTNRSSVYISVVDIEPNVNGDDVVNLLIANNTIDGRLRTTDLYTSITVNGTAANTKFQSIQVSNNLLLGQEDNVSAVRTQTEGIGMRGVSNGIISHNQIAGCGQVGIYAIDSYNIRVTGNQSFNCGFDTGAFIFRDLLNSVIDGNWIKLPSSYPNLEYNANKILEEIVTKTVSVNGRAVTKDDGSKWDYWLIGRQVKINGTDRTVLSLNTNNTVMVIDTDLGVLTSVPYLSNSSGNIYKDNVGAWYSLPAASTSRNLTANSLSRDVSPGNSACVGTSTLVEGTVEVTSNCIKANSKIYYSRKVAGGDVGNMTYTVANGVFELVSTSPTDTSTIDWQVVN